METEIDIDLFDSYYEYAIYAIEQNEKHIESFDSDTLFRNITFFIVFLVIYHLTIRGIKKLYVD